MVKIPFQLQKRLKNDPKISNFSNDLKNVSIHSGGHYNIKIKHFEHFSRVGGAPGAPLMSSRVNMIHKVDPNINYI